MKRLRFENGPLDAVDAVILQTLAADARMSMTDLAKSVGLSAPSVTERVRRLEEAGVIGGYAAVIDPAALGLPLAAYLRIRPTPGLLRQVADLLKQLPAIVECDRVTGEDCFVAKAYVRDVAELEALIDEIIPYAMTNTSIIQSSPVQRRLPPIAGLPERLSINGFVNKT
ncbi:Lrp/AsnC family transcriptional regulator [Skermanella aerolata]|uniref:Lrp/AsnC family transcriptional regulator n=1 Tax=Skermanella aerolata TaxID=393310 RepID=UPI003D1A6EB7